MDKAKDQELNTPDGDDSDPELFIAYLKDRLPMVEEAIGLTSPGPLTNEPVKDDLDRYLYAPLEQFTASGGKRVRPVLALLGAEAVGGRPEDALSCGVAIELFQSAALIHDDIADKSELRRGEPCLYRTEGVGIATNVGDLALTEVFETVLNDVQLPNDRKVCVLNELVRMERHTLEGQSLDLGWARDERWDVSADDYLYMVDAKTAWYSVAIPLYVGALCGGATKEDAEGLIDLGRHAGVAFQLQDDLLNLVGSAEAQGKDFRSDITEGKRTLAVVWALEHLDEDQRAELINLLEAETTDADELARAVELLEESGGIEHCQKMAAQEAAAAKNAARKMAAASTITPQAGDLLCSMAEYFVTRER